MLPKVILIIHFSLGYEHPPTPTPSSLQTLPSCLEITQEQPDNSKASWDANSNRITESHIRLNSECVQESNTLTHPKENNKACYDMP